MSLFPLKPTSAHVKKYYEALAVSHKHGHTTEGNTRFAFEELLRRCVSPYGWHVVPEYAFKGTDKQPLRADGALVDDLSRFDHLEQMLVTPLPAPADTHATPPQAGKKHGQH